MATDIDAAGQKIREEIGAAVGARLGRIRATRENPLLTPKTPKKAQIYVFF